MWLVKDAQIWGNTCSSFATSSIALQNTSGSPKNENKAWILAIKTSRTMRIQGKVLNDTGIAWIIHNEMQKQKRGRPMNISSRKACLMEEIFIWLSCSFPTKQYFKQVMVI